MKRVVAVLVMVCAAVVVAVGTDKASHEHPPAVPAPTHIDAEFDPESHGTAISWDEPVARGHGRNGVPLKCVAGATPPMGD